MFEKLENDIGIPIVSIIYDGTASKRNEVLAPYLFYIRKNVSKTTKFEFSTGGIQPESTN